MKIRVFFIVGKCKQFYKALTYSPNDSNHWQNYRHTISKLSVQILLQYFNFVLYKLGKLFFLEFSSFISSAFKISEEFLVSCRVLT